MFLNDKERKFLLEEIKRVAAKDALIMVELYPALDSYFKTEAECLGFQKEFFGALGWQKIKYYKLKFIARNA